MSTPPRIERVLGVPGRFRLTVDSCTFSLGLPEVQALADSLLRVLGSIARDQQEAAAGARDDAATLAEATPGLRRAAQGLFDTADLQECRTCGHLRRFHVAGRCRKARCGCGGWA
jgi:hypothetical protein